MKFLYLFGGPESGDLPIVEAFDLLKINLLKLPMRGDSLAIFHMKTSKTITKHWESLEIHWGNQVPTGTWWWFMKSNEI